MVVTDILNSHQNRSKNKLVGENGVTRVHGNARSGLWTPDLRRIFCFSLCKIKGIGSLGNRTTATCHTRAT